MTFHIISLFPESFKSYIDASVLGRAVKKKLVKIVYYNPRDYGEGKWRKTDGKPFGGGPGMVLLPGPVLRATTSAIGRKRNVKIIFLSPGGRKFIGTESSHLVHNYKHIVIICGRYEGIDARVKKILNADEVSVGDFVVTGGELPAMVIMDAVSRHIPGVLGKLESLEENRISSRDVYTRPEIFVWKREKHRVPKVLLSGNHAHIDAWRTKHSKKKN